MQFGLGVWGCVCIWIWIGLGSLIWYNCAFVIRSRDWVLILFTLCFAGFFFRAFSNVLICYWWMRLCAGNCCWIAKYDYNAFALLKMLAIILIYFHFHGTAAPQVRCISVLNMLCACACTLPLSLSHFFSFAQNWTNYYYFVILRWRCNSNVFVGKSNPHLCATSLAAIETKPFTTFEFILFFIYKSQKIDDFFICFVF